MIFARKSNKNPEFYMIFHRKMHEYYMIFARKIIFPIFFWGGGRTCPLPPPLPRLIHLCIECRRGLPVSLHQAVVRVYCYKVALRQDVYCLKLKCFFTAGASQRHNVSANSDELVLSGLASSTSFRVSLQAASRLVVGPAAVKYHTTRALRTRQLVNYLDLQSFTQCVCFTCNT